MHFFLTITAFAAAVLARPARIPDEKLPHTGAIRQHNHYRRIHQAPDMKWDAGLEAEAKAWTSQCNWWHHTDNYGQNLAYGYSDDPISGSVDLWYSEEPDFEPYYGQADAPYSHFTQLVWKSSTKLGCHTQFCPTLNAEGGGVEANDVYITACNYYEPGNYAGEFANNVFPPKG